MSGFAQQIFATPEHLGLVVARDIFRRMQAAAGKPFLLGCPGGRSPEPVYQALAALIDAAQWDLSKLIIVMMDDYLVPAEGGLTKCLPTAISAVAALHGTRFRLC